MWLITKVQNCFFFIADLSVVELLPSSSISLTFYTFPVNILSYRYLEGKTQIAEDVTCTVNMQNSTYIYLSILEFSPFANFTDFCLTIRNFTTKPKPFCSGSGRISVDYSYKNRTQEINTAQFNISLINTTHVPEVRFWIYIHGKKFWILRLFEEFN